MSDNVSFKIDYPNKYFMQLHANFWDSLEKIGNHHQIKCNYLLEEMPNLKEEDKKLNESKILTVAESLKTIVQSDLRYYYILYLKYIFCLSQPLTMNQLKTNFKNKLFPYFLFTLLIKKKEINHLIIDFFEKKILIMNKDKIINCISHEKIISLSKKANASIVIKLSEKELNKEIEIIPEFFQQVDLIYSIIQFFIQNFEEKKNINSQDEKEMNLLEDDTYLPKGILLKAHILKEHQNKLLSKDRRYAVLGSSMIIIFKDSSMKEIRNIIPLLIYATQLISDDKELIITFKYFYRDQSLTFFEENTYLEWKQTIKDIFNKKIVEKLEGLSLYQIKEKKLNSKILDLLNDEIKRNKDDINNNNGYYEDMKKKIVEDNENIYNDEKISLNRISTINQ